MGIYRVEPAVAAADGSLGDGRLAKGFEGIIQRLAGEPGLRHVLEQLADAEQARLGDNRYWYSLRELKFRLGEMVPAQVVPEFLAIINDSLSRLAHVVVEVETGNPDKAKREPELAEAKAGPAGHSVRAASQEYVGDVHGGQASSGNNGGGRHDKNMAGMPARRFA